MYVYKCEYICFKEYFVLYLRYAQLEKFLVSSALHRDDSSCEHCGQVQYCKCTAVDSWRTVYRTFTVDSWVRVPYLHCGQVEYHIPYLHCEQVEYHEPYLHCEKLEYCELYLQCALMKYHVPYLHCVQLSTVYRTFTVDSWVPCTVPAPWRGGVVCTVPALWTAGV